MGGVYERSVWEECIVCLLNVFSRGGAIPSAYTECLPVERVQ
jgi:hypothetical protein